MDCRVIKSIKTFGWIYGGLTSVFVFCLLVVHLKLNVGGVLFFALGPLLAFPLMYYSIRYINQYFFSALNPELCDIQCKDYQSRSLMINLGFEDAFNRCVDVPSRLKGINITWVSKELGLINFETNLNFKSCGERISVFVSELDNGCTKVVLISNPKQPQVMFEYGKSLENVNKITADLLNSGL